MKSYFLKAFLGCCLITNAASAQTLVANGDFSANGSGFCSGAPIGWTSTTGVELTDGSNNNNWWVDLSDCYYYGNSRDISQTIQTIPGHIYGVGFDLGSWNDDAQIKAGVTVSAGTTVMTFRSDDFTGSPLAWRRYGFCFTALDYQTTITFMCDPELSSTSPGWAVAYNPNPPYNHNVTVVGIDNIVVVEKGYDLIANGTFQQDGLFPVTTVYHKTPKSWKASTIYHGTGDMQLSDQWQTNDFWIDLTDDKDNDGRWVEQTVSSADNMMYRISFSVGAGDKDDAGVDLYIDNVYKGNFTHKTNGSYLSWKHYYYDVKTSGGSTSVKFVCKSPTGKADVVGLDNVSMVLKCCYAEMIPGPGEVGDEPPCDCPPSDGKEKYANSVKNISGENSMSIYPNPAQTVLTVSMQQHKGADVHYRVYDITGREMLNGNQQVNTASQLSIPVHQLPPGTYVIAIEGDFPVIKQKFVKD